ncbi:EAL domain-containing protein [Parahaliea sp. F7430]|uniref:cyclic-guanylate-specific phosphodiesterase n=1 Tax=Sediminihaliea albiluteola TaxID=2758564 RepID=A0A7W2TXE6_9GAMM|nr:EAL domain-containing protein [Sediminihaliea albiluteola]MBA6413708.1 EAL domain-containing protein [Sediminihaliea albiluteola]
MSKAGRQKPARSKRLILRVLVNSILGALCLFFLLGWYLWHQSIVAEEQRLATVAERLGLEAESAILDIRGLLERLNRADIEPCSDLHIQWMQQEAIARPYIRSIGYWRAIKRQCGAGFVQGAILTPPEASRIYDNGVIAWWPSPETAVGDVELFLMRFGDHDVAIDPRLLLDTTALDQQAGLWVENLLLVSSPTEALLPEPSTLEPGLTIDSDRQLIVSRFSLNTVFPMDVVAVQPSGQLVERYLPSLITAAVLGILLIVLWVLAVFRVSQRQLSFSAELTNAIKNGNITVAYQPIVDLSTGRCHGAEALARWQREDGEIISPDLFIPVAEKSNSIHKLTLLVIKRVVEEMGQLLATHDQFSININLSAQDLEHPLIALELKHILDSAKLPASAIKFEITERALVNHEDSRKLISKLRRRGHQMAIDDFGTGYSSLSYLETFELDTLKLDKAFVDAIETHAVTSSVIVHIIEMAKSLELDMVAEGIESAHQVQWLANNGVQRGQGYYYSKPLTAAEFLKYHAKQR